MERRCTRCHSWHKSKRYKRCWKCREAARNLAKSPDYAEVSKDYQEALKRNGLCATCTKRPAEEERTRCQQCLDANKASVLRRRNKILSQKSHRCSRCFRVTKRSARMCDKCRMWAKEYWRKTHKSTCGCGFEKHHKDPACAVCLSLSTPGASRKSPKLVPAVIGAWKRLGVASVYDVAEEAKTTTRTVLRVLSRLKSLNAVSLVEVDGALRRWRLEVSNG